MRITLAYQQHDGLYPQSTEPLHYSPGWLAAAERGRALKMPGSGKKKHTQEEKKGRERATWTPSVSVKVNISDIPPGTLAYRGQRSWWQTSDPGALRGQERSLWNLSAGGRGTQRYIQQTRRAMNERIVDYKVSGPQHKQQKYVALIPRSCSHSKVWPFLPHVEVNAELSCLRTPHSTVAYYECHTGPRKHVLQLKSLQMRRITRKWMSTATVQTDLA